MSKILAVADIHIDDYSSRNPSNKYRLYQARTVAQNIIDVGKAEGCDYIVFAGDVVEKSMVKSHIQFEVKYFFDAIMKNFKEGYLIYGNHDMEGRLNEQDVTDSFVGIMLPENLHYAHHQIIVIDGCRIGFNNYQPEIDLDWIPEKVDVLFTHADICYNDSDFFESQKLDESKFDVAVCGHIHRKAEIGKYISIGVPQKCKMGDSDESSGVIVDCASKHCEWVNLNPHDNIMKFVYTQDLEMSDYWDPDTLTWYVYKPEGIMVQDENGKLKVAAWDEIEDMINEAIVKSNLQGVHSEVLKNIGNMETHEVDFNFTLVRFHCENWRSIDDMTIYFSDGDRILIRGNNGSGKTSVLSAIKYAFIDTGDTQGLASLQPFIQFGAKKCLTEVEFYYQGNKYILRRGTQTKDNALWVNDEQMKYPSKKSFNEDIRARFPFVEYLDAFFFDADHNQFIGSMTPERKTEIMSKFLKLDKIDSYNQMACIMAEGYRKTADGWLSKAKEAQQFIDYIDQKLGTIVLPAVSKEELERQLNEGLEIQRQNAEWNKYNSLTAGYTAQIQEYQNKLTELYQEQQNFRDPGVIDYEISSIQAEITNQQSRLVELGNIGISLQFKKKELQDKITEGNTAWTEAQNIGIGKVCSHCGQPIKTSEALEAHKAELFQKVEQLRPVINGLKAEVASLEEQQRNASGEISQLNANISTYTSEVSKRMTEKSRQQQVLGDIQKYTGLLDQVQTRISSLGVVPKVDLPDNFMETMASLQSGISAWKLWEDNIGDRATKAAELQECQVYLGEIGNLMADLENYIKLTGPTGVIYEEIMNKLSVQFSDTTVNYAVTRKGKGNREHLDLNPQFINNGNYVDYTAASSGQKTLCDLHFLSKIVTRLGLLILDEFLKHLDSGNHDMCVDLISEMNVGCIMISSHMESIPAFNNRTFMLSLSDSGQTQIDIK